MDIAMIKERIKKTTQQPVYTVCTNIIDHLSKMSPEQAQRITFTMLRSWITNPVDDKILFAALNALTSIKDVLTPYFLFLDEDDDREIEVSAYDAYDAHEKNYFIHPRTGDEVEDFRDLLRPAYKVSEYFFVDRVL